MAEKKRILVVDDEPDFALLVQGNLQKEGFAVDVAYNGVEGLEKIKQNPPDAIVLDVMMPEKDGYEVCAELKQDDRFADIAILSGDPLSDVDTLRELVVVETLVGGVSVYLAE